MKYFFISGESSGDLHTSNVVKHLKSVDVDAQFFGSGGKHMEKAGVQLCLNISEMAYMGVVEVVKNILTIRKNFQIVQQAILETQPDVVVLVDYPGFNLRMAKWAKENGFKVVYYIAPQIWAWKESRVKKIKKYVDLVLVILPFEKELYTKYQVPAVYVGHPLLERIPDVQPEGEKTKIAILPGSRKQEIDKMLPVMIEAMHVVGNQQQLVVAGLSEHGEAYYQSMIRGRAILVMDKTYEVLEQAKLAIVASGTASLETALFKVPQVVCYAMHPFTYWIAKMLVKVNYISLVNIITSRPVVPEMIQKDFTPVAVKNASMEVMLDTLNVQEGYQQLRKMLGSGDTSFRVANILYKFAGNQGD